MDRGIRVRDLFGRTLILYEEPRYGPPMTVDDEQYAAPDGRPSYPPPSYYEAPRHPAGGSSTGRRKRKGVTWLLGIPWFFLSFAACEIHPAFTFCSWGVLLGWLVYRSFRD